MGSASINSDDLRPKNVFILGLGSDIGQALADCYLRDGFHVYGTYRNIKSLENFKNRNRLNLIPCDLACPDGISKAVEVFAGFNIPWDIFISTVGTTEPVGPFFSCDFDAWENSISVNSSAQLRALHALHPLRRTGALCHAVFFAGGGTNNPLPNFSAYVASKILLIKMCELLDKESEDINFFIVGPGWVRTKIHNEVLNEPEKAKQNYQRVKEFLNSDQPGTSMEAIYNCINWCVSQGKEVSGGRNFSVVYDSWQKDENSLAQKLREDPNKFKLRRWGNEGPEK